MINPQDKISAILHTGRKTAYSDNRTLIFSGLKSSFIANDFSGIRNKLSPEARWLGYFSYDLKNSLEKLPHDQEFFITTPLSWFGEFNDIKTIESASLPKSKFKNPEVAYVRSNMSKAEYLNKVEKIREYIKNGDIYQANLTRKFYGEFKNECDAYQLFLKLNELSPAPYSAYIKIDDLHIISSSPELFLRVDESGNVITCPIKGSAGKGEGAKLKASDKDMAENLMITDLMRNDLSRACEIGSVKVDKLFEVDELKTISHMHSVITGKLAKGNTSLDLIKDCFPPGSMTGAPKIRAMEICSELEVHKRGIYSGILGYFDENNSCEFSVVIRTIMIKGNKFEFQVGGGITYASDAESEWNETMIKAKPMADALDIFDEIKEL